MKCAALPQDTDSVMLCFMLSLWKALGVPMTAEETCLISNAMGVGFTDTN